MVWYTVVVNRKQQGDVGVAAAIFYYTKAGHTVCLPATDNARYDLVIDDGSCLNRVQVKSTGWKTPHGVYSVQLATKGGNKTADTIKKICEDECDLVFVYVMDESMYEFPVKFVAGRGSLNLGKLCNEYKLV